MKAKDYPIEWDNLWSCCEQHIQECSDDVSLGSIIECEYCQEEMILAKCDDGVIRWRNKKNV